MKKILVIDDDPDILEAIALILEVEGYEYLTTTKSDLIYKKIKTYQPDAIVLDVLLSGNDGRKICKNLKSDSKTKHIPILMISAHPTAKESTKSSGAEGFLAKPFSINELLAEIDHLTVLSK